MQSMLNSFELKRIKSSFTDPCFWSYDLQPLARGVAAGLAAAVIPGLQIFYAAILVFVLRGNLPVALLSTLVTNPLTVVPVTYSVYYIGTLILGNHRGEFVIKDFQWDFSSFHAFWSNLSAWVLQFGKGFLIGLPIASLLLGIIGYFGTLFIWEIMVLFFGKPKKKKNK